MKIGSSNMGGALQPLREKINEIEILIKTNNFGVFGIIEANLFMEHDEKEVETS